MLVSPTSGELLVACQGQDKRLISVEVGENVLDGVSQCDITSREGQIIYSSHAPIYTMGTTAKPISSTTNGIGTVYWSWH